MKTRKFAGIGAAMALSIAMTATPAFAGTGDVLRHGGCSGAPTWKMKASPQNGRIEVEGEVHSTRTGQAWRWYLKHDGSVSARGTSTTRGLSHSFTARRVVVNLRGADTLTFVARHGSSGSVCRGTVRF